MLVVYSPESFNLVLHLLSPHPNKYNALLTGDNADVYGNKNNRWP